MTVDSHQHFWRYSPSEFGWISDAMRSLRRDFLPADLRREIHGVGVTGVVSVQARQSVEETRFLLDIAARSDFVLGVVGWVPLSDPGVVEVLDEFAAVPAFKGCRHVVQDEPDDDYMLDSRFNEGVRAVTAAGLAYDILVYERHLPVTPRFVDRHPKQRFILDHLGKPRIRDRSFTRWDRLIRDLARRPNVYCKLSGMVTEANWHRWEEAQFRPYFDTVLEAFGPRRLMFGSDWPVCLVATCYGRWLEIVRTLVSGLGESERDRIMAGTAIEAYGLQPDAALD